MSLFNSITRQNPLDINKDITIGVALPLDETNMFKGTETTTEQSKTNLLSLLLTYPGERINLPNYGIGLKNLIFEQNVDLEALKEAIIAQVNRYVPLVSIRDINTSKSNDEHTLFVSVSYIYLMDGSTNNIQIKFR